ncbi:hypothetical protein SAMN05428967_1372 [Phyllobacterium sp. YR620]|uniref:DUF1993 domain-containing protein n=1 Tax=unclassified Phyllobacterium TaxID=2638441 RepID=UPI0008841477|nr:MULTISPECIES: DUF1993 domain-containing protein [unclassified Phyllobacterium]MRG55427.1 DUF1993 family protein [Phyllobacterium sp. SYP-B3895]SDP14750.1 hypothetical protein SAMN05428967_1372 [Phyllobacterium sp. YR620]SFJ14178.1 hypothetical protein SAMN04515648_2850 [Phyllobacterium sp. CL33Tsu]
MALNMYTISVPAYLRGFAVLASLIEKAEAYAEEKKINPTVLVNARLAPDMLSLAGQIQRASDTAKATIGRLTTLEIPKFADEEASLADLRERIAKTVAFLESVDAGALDGAETKDVVLSAGQLKVTLSGEEYVQKFALPNFYFHVTTAYDILRHNGLQVGKLNYIGALS